MYAFPRAKEDVHHCHTAIIAVEQSLRRLVQEDAVDGASVVSLTCGGGFFILEEITSDH